MRVAIIAGEASGDILGAGLIAALRRRYPQLQAEGIGGARMIDLGFSALYPLEKLSVMGFIEPIKHLPELFSIRSDLLNRWRDNPPDLFIGIDSPDFNLGLELKLKKLGITTVHYVSPSVWAWRQRRIKKIDAATDLVLTLFPFETTFYQQHQVAAAFVGHPLADQIPLTIDTQQKKSELGVAPDRPVVAIMPGSRMSEVTRLTEPFLQTVRWLQQRHPAIQFVTAFVSQATEQYFRSEMLNQGLSSSDVLIHQGASADVMAASDCILLASGTATLESMLMKKPMVVAYRMNGLTFSLVKRLVKVEHVALPNLLAKDSLVPEFIQDDVKPDLMGAAVLAFLNNPEQVEHLRSRFDVIHRSLRKGADESAAQAVVALLNSNLAVEP